MSADYLGLLEREEEFRLSEQSALIDSLLGGGASRGKLSLLRRAGLAMTGLEVVGRRSGTGGRLVIEFKGILRESTRESSSKTVSKSSRDSVKTQPQQPQHTQPSCFKPGDLVKLIVGGSLLLKCTGTVERSSRDIDVSISINSTDDSEEMETITSTNNKIGLVKIVDEVGMFGRMKANLELIKCDDSQLNDLKSFLK